MTQVLFYSIQSEPIANILKGLKTIEVRKRDLPQWANDKLARGEKVVGYGYCTKCKPYLYTINGTHIVDDNDKGSWGNVLNGLVVVKFEVSGSELIFYGKGFVIHGDGSYEDTDENMYYIHQGELDKSCLTYEQVLDYGNGKDLYAHHLTNIQPVNMELGEFEVWYGGEESFYILKRVPQSFMTCWVKGE